jgi:PIN domain nuclease of toxin-antitoxin system
VILLIDAHVLVWWLDDAAQLSEDARSAIADPGNEVVVSAASVWELAIKRAASRIDLPAGSLRAAVDASGFSHLAVTSDDAESAAALPPHHLDPFDRMLVAQARRIGAVIVSRDSAIPAYDVEVLQA